jgi:hypothetical protein
MESSGDSKIAVKQNLERSVRCNRFGFRSNCSFRLTNVGFPISHYELRVSNPVDGAARVNCLRNRAAQLRATALGFSSPDDAKTALSEAERTDREADRLDADLRGLLRGVTSAPIHEQI